MTAQGTAYEKILAFSSLSLDLRVKMGKYSKGLEKQGFVK